MTANEIRRRRLKQLAADTDGGLAAIAAVADVSARNLDHIVKERKQGTKREKVETPNAAMGEKLARGIEKGMGLPPGWLDWPFEHVDFGEWIALDAYQQAAVQGQLNAAIKEAKSKRIAPAVARSAVPDATVERHLPPLPKNAAKEAAQRANKASQARATVRVTDKLRQRSMFTDNDGT